MVSLAEQIDLHEEYEKYPAAGTAFATSATWQDMAEWKVAKEDVFALGREEPKHKKKYIYLLLAQRVAPKSDVESGYGLENYLGELLSHASESPFDVLDEQLSGEEKVARLIKFIRKQSNLQFAKQLASRLTWLSQAAKDEDPKEVPIAPKSLTNFIAFIQKMKNLKYPDVVLTPSNEIRAQWRTAPNRHFAVVFLSTGDARYVIFSPNPKDPDKIDRLSGITSVDTLMENAEPHGVLEWASQ